EDQLGSHKVEQMERAPKSHTPSVNGNEENPINTNAAAIVEAIIPTTAFQRQQQATELISSS
ncbi:MAG TPA: hypothetical protein VK145_00510, partial [Candidatus Nanoarchaeia archaeon]|nr:hypothetical protein [Candidatus Nanoarchaeia archaeon]